LITVKDSDGDGIINTEDQCPRDGETFNSFQDTDGCPDVLPDTDKDDDNIIDTIDKCPTQTETMNGFEDSDGCPDTPPPPENPVDEKPADNSGLYQWAAVIAAGITAAGGIAASKLKKG
jgi:hypothetical protein